MPLITTATGLLLIAEGLIIGFGFSESSSPTRLIPAFVGLPILIAGLLAFKPAFRAHAIHAALLIALLGALASAFRLPSAMTSENGTRVGLVSMLLLFVTCVGYLLVCIRSFIGARRKRRELPAAG
jgi:hypothetical protein